MLNRNLNTALEGEPGAEDFTVILNRFVYCQRMKTRFTLTRHFYWLLSITEC
jgi:hypothetical protein